MEKFILLQEEFTILFIYLDGIFSENNVEKFICTGGVYNFCGGREGKVK